MKEQLSKNEIRGIFMRNGFTIKEGCDDLKDYVYAAAYDLLKAQEERHRTIEARLSSIEKLLGAESRPLSPSEYKAIWHGEVDQEPEWRPMSEAPKDRGIDVRLNGESKLAWYAGNGKWNVSGFILHEVDISGWRPL